MRENTETRAGGQSSSLRAAIMRFLGKMAFFSGMVAVGVLGMLWIPIPAPPPLNWIDAVTAAAGLCASFMWFAGAIGLGVTVFTAGRKPRWD